MPGRVIFSRRGYLVYREMHDKKDCSLKDALEAVEAAGQRHPEWDMDEQREFDEWDALYDAM